ncbi:MAG: YbaK/EbsC family protein [Eubacterium sp.]|nr:YbaK/EbsC family protein [Eubacterium sp.]
MSLERAEKHLEKYGLAERIHLTDQSSATVELAAKAVGVEPGRIAKTLSFLVDGKAVLILTEGTARIDNHKFKETFHTKAKMIPADQVEALVGHAPGGVCPFGINEGIPVYLDLSLKKYDTVYPAAGTSNSDIELTIAELEKCSEAEGWVDVCKTVD